MAVTAIPPARRTATIRITGTTLATLLVSIITLAVFGPYVAGPVRTEQLAVYGLAALALPLMVLRFRPGAGIWLFAAWAALVFVAMVGVVFPYRGPQPWEPGSTLAGVDNLVLPLVVMLLMWSAVSPEAALRVLGAVARVVVWATAANGVVALISTRANLDTYLRPFWSGAEGLTVAENALGNGRLTGLFNQPAEAGVMYGVAGLLAVYLYASHLPRLLLVLAGIIIGGVLSVSKVFLLCGLPLILYALLRAGGGVRPVRLFVMIGAAVAVVEAGVFSQWTGSNYLVQRLVPTEDVSLVQFYTAGRWNAGSNVQTVISEVLNISPVAGVGAAGWSVPYDSALTETMVVSGLFGMACYAIVLAVFGAIALRIREPRLRLLATCFALLMIGASLGISPLTANRVSTVSWVVITLLILVYNHERMTHRPAPTR